MDTLSDDLATPDSPVVGSLLVPERLAEWAWTLGFTALLASLSVLRYHLWVAGSFGLEKVEHDLWLLAHRGTHTFSSTDRPIFAGGDSPSLVVLAPLYRLGGVGLLFFLQALALSLGYVLLRKIGRDVGAHQSLTHTLGVVYLLHPILLGNALADFHVETLAVPLLLGLVAAVLQELWGIYWIFLLASLLVKDVMGFSLLGIGLVLILRGHFGRGVLTCVLAGGAPLAIQALAEGPLSQGWRGVWGGVPSITGGMAGANPHLFLIGTAPGRLIAWAILGVLILPLLPVLVSLRLKALSPWWIPGLAAWGLDLALLPRTSTPSFVAKSALALPFIFAALLEGGSKTPPGPRDPRLLRAWLVLPLLALAGLGWYTYRTQWQTAPRNLAALQEAASVIPAGVPVLAPNIVAAHLADREAVWTVDSASTSHLPPGTYVILDRSLPRSSGTDWDSILSDPGLAQIVYAKSGVTVRKLLRPVVLDPARRSP